MQEAGGWGGRVVLGQVVESRLLPGASSHGAVRSVWDGKAGGGGQHCTLSGAVALPVPSPVLDVGGEGCSTSSNPWLPLG